MGHNAGANVTNYEVKIGKNRKGVLLRHEIVSRKMSAVLIIVLNDATKIINYIKSRSLRSNLFKLIKI